MQVDLKNPEIEKFLDDEVKAGHFPSTDAAVEAAIEQMMRERSESQLDDATAAAINRAEAQIDAGEGIDFKTFAAEFRKKFTPG